MFRNDGFNPLRWDCKKKGCFNKKCRPKIEIFSDCFPGRINFGDVDGLVEINGKGLLLEWKSQLEEIPTGQRIAWERLTKDGKFSTLCLVGNAETMEISHFKIAHKGKISSWGKCNLQEAKQRIKRWVEYAQAP